MDVMLVAVRPWSDPKAKGLLPLSTPLPSPPLTQNGIHPFLSLLFMCCSPWQSQRPTALLSSPHLGPAQKYLLVLLLDTPTFLDEFFTKALGTDRDRGCSIEIDPECECFIPDAEDRSDGGRINGRVARNRIKKARSDGEGGAGPI